MGNDREEASRAAEVLVPLGFAVAADDAVLHGEPPQHPVNPQVLG